MKWSFWLVVTVAVLDLLAAISMVVADLLGASIPVFRTLSFFASSVLCASAAGWAYRNRPRPRPDYARIARLEQELGLAEKPRPRPGGVIRTETVDGVSVVYRTWGAS